MLRVCMCVCIKVSLTRSPEAPEQRCKQHVYVPGEFGVWRFYHFFREINIFGHTNGVRHWLYITCFNLELVLCFSRPFNNIQQLLSPNYQHKASPTARLISLAPLVFRYYIPAVTNVHALLRSLANISIYLCVCVFVLLYICKKLRK